MCIYIYIDRHIHIHIHVQMYIYVHMYVCWAVVTFRTHPPTRDSGVSDSQLVCVYEKRLCCLYIHYICIYTHQRETAESLLMHTHTLTVGTSLIGWLQLDSPNCSVPLQTELPSSIFVNILNSER